MMKRTGHQVKFEADFRSGSHYHLPDICSESVPLLFPGQLRGFNFTGLQLSAKQYCLPMKSSLFDLFFSLNADTRQRLGVNSVWDSKKWEKHKTSCFNSLLLDFSALKSYQLQPSVLVHIKKSKVIAGIFSMTLKSILFLIIEKNNC